MDEILEKFENTMGTGRAEDDQSHKDLYKNWGRYGNQEERRNEILRQQRSNRENKLDSCRGILNLVQDSEDKRHVFKRYSRARYQPNVYVPGFTNTSDHYVNVLMLSEWLVEKPEDFSTNWYVTPSPKGVRVLVIASNGMTRCYTKYGQLCCTMTTLLPGGGNNNEKWKFCSVLDGFYCKDTKTIYVLDILSWKNHIMADGEMEFRHYWLQTTFNENPELGKVTRKNKVALVLLPKTPCDPDSFQQFMMEYPPLNTTSGKLDGFLFYHKQATYVAGETPLVGWLYPYMVPEVLCPGMCIHDFYAIKPDNYVDQATFIQIFEEKCFRKKMSSNRQKESNIASEGMDAEDGPVTQDDSIEDEITEENVADNAPGEAGDTGTMDTENGGDKVENGYVQAGDSGEGENQGESIEMEENPVEAATPGNNHVGTNNIAQNGGEPQVMSQIIGPFSNHGAANLKDSKPK